MAASEVAADLQFLQPLPAFLAQRIPAGEVRLAVAGDVLGRRLQREVRRGEREVLEERLVGVLLGVFLQALDGVVGDGGGGVVAGLRHRRAGAACRPRYAGAA